jgi:anti-anti-sigma factor
MISVQEAEGVSVVLLSGRLDGKTVAAFETGLIGAVAAGHGTVIDLSDLTYVASVGLRVILLAAKRTKQVGERFALCSPQPQVREVFEIGGFDTLLTLCDTRDAALRLVQSKKPAD